MPRFSDFLAQAVRVHGGELPRVTYLGAMQVCMGGVAPVLNGPFAVPLDDTAGGLPNSGESETVGASVTPVPDGLVATLLDDVALEPLTARESETSYPVLDGVPFVSPTSVEETVPVPGGIVAAPLEDAVMEPPIAGEPEVAYHVSESTVDLPDLSYPENVFSYSENEGLNVPVSLVSGSALPSLTFPASDGLAEAPEVHDARAFSSLPMVALVVGFLLSNVPATFAELVERLEVTGHRPTPYPGKSFDAWVDTGPLRLLRLGIGCFHLLRKGMSGSG